MLERYTENIPYKSKVPLIEKINETESLLCYWRVFSCQFYWEALTEN